MPIVKDVGYKIEAKSMTEAVEQLVHQFKQMNPGVDVFDCGLTDGSSLKLKIGKKARRAQS